MRFRLTRVNCERWDNALIGPEARKLKSFATVAPIFAEPPKARSLHPISNYSPAWQYSTATTRLRIDLGSMISTALD